MMGRGRGICLNCEPLSLYLNDSYYSVILWLSLCRHATDCKISIHLNYTWLIVCVCVCACVCVMVCEGSSLLLPMWWLTAVISRTTATPTVHRCPGLREIKEITHEWKLLWSIYLFHPQLWLLKGNEKIESVGPLFNMICTIFNNLYSDFLPPFTQHFWKSSCSFGLADAVQWLHLLIS